MNYYKRYAIDHTARTAHLSILEEGAYTRLLDWQYSNEAPLPPTPAERYRITRATTLAERRVTDKMAEIYFGADGWQQRARQEIERSRPSVDAHRAQAPTLPRLDLAALLRARSANEGEVPQGVADLIRIPCGQAPAPVREEPSAGDAPDSPDDETIPAPIATLGLKVLAASPIPPDTARFFLARMRKAVGDAGTLELLQACERDGTAAPLSWLRKAVEERKGQELHGSFSRPLSRSAAT